MKRVKLENKVPKAAFHCSMPESLGTKENLEREVTKVPKVKKVLQACLEVKEIKAAKVNLETLGTKSGDSLELLE